MSVYSSRILLQGCCKGHFTNGKNHEHKNVFNVVDAIPGALLWPLYIFLCPKEANIYIYNTYRHNIFKHSLWNLLLFSIPSACAWFQPHLPQQKLSKQAFVQLDGHWKNYFMSTSCHIIACTNSIMFSQESQSTITAPGDSRLLPTCLWTLATHHQNKKKVPSVFAATEKYPTHCCEPTHMIRTLSHTCLHIVRMWVRNVKVMKIHSFETATTNAHWCRALTEVIANGNQHLYDSCSCWQLVVQDICLDCLGIRNVGQKSYSTSLLFQNLLLKCKLKFPHPPALRPTALKLSGNILTCRVTFQIQGLVPFFRCCHNRPQASG